MIRYVDLQTNIEKEIQPEDVETFSLTNVWFELVDPTENELQAIAEAVDISVNFLRLPKSHSAVDLRLEPDFGVINFLVMQDVVATKKVYPIVLVFAKNFLLTITKKEVQSIVDVAKARMSKAKIDPPSQVAYFIIDEVIADHYIHIEKLEGVTSKIEEEVLEKTSQETLKHIFKLKTNMVRFNKILWYQRGLAFNLRKCSDDCMPTKVRALFDTTHEELTRQIDIVETYREILSDAINVHLSAVSNKINLSIQGLTVVIFYLTIITTLTSFPNTIATFFGISQFGNTDIAIIAVAILLSIALPLVWLWRKKWLRFPKMQ
jgi:magnesium transporter